MFLEFFKFSTNQRVTLLIMCSLGFAKGFFPLRFPRKSPRPPCFWQPFGAGFIAEYARLFAPKGDRSFLVAGRAKVSLYLSPRGWDFFGCRRGKGVLLPTTEGMGVFWLREGRGCLSTYHRGGWSFLVARGARVSSFLPPWGGWSFLVAGRARVSLCLPPRGRSRKTPTPQAGWAVVGYCGRIIGAKRILYERNVGGLNNLVLAQEEQ